METLSLTSCYVFTIYMRYGVAPVLVDLELPSGALPTGSPLCWEVVEVATGTVSSTQGTVNITL